MAIPDILTVVSVTVDLNKHLLPSIIIILLTEYSGNPRYPHRRLHHRRPQEATVTFNYYYSVNRI